MERTKGKPNRLELHRLRFKKEKGVQLLSLSEMSKSEIAFVSKKVFEIISSRKVDFYTAYRDFYADWGIMCPHPQEKRLYLGWLQMSVHTSANKWFKCSCCNTTVVNVDWMKDRLSRGESVRCEKSGKI